jgi:hypothetical protein
MPLHDFFCPACHTEWEGYVRWPEWLAEWHKQQPCVCGAPGRPLLSRPTVRPDLVPYYDDGLGARVLSRAHRRTLMAAASLVENDAPVRPHGTRGTIFSFPGRTTESVPKSGAFKKKAG